MLLMDTRKDRLVKAFEELRHKKKVRNQTDFGDQLGYNKQYISKLFNGHEEFGYHFATEMLTVYAINRDWLLEGEGEMFTDSKKQTPEVVTESEINSAENDENQENGTDFVVDSTSNQNEHTMSNYDYFKRLDKKDEQIDRLITIIETISGVSSEAKKVRRG